MDRDVVRRRITYFFCGNTYIRGGYMRELRNEIGMTVRELAERIGITPWKLTTKEIGNYRVSEEELDRIVRAFCDKDRILK